jgi:hypothetical protein
MCFVLDMSVFLKTITNNYFCEYNLIVPKEFEIKHSKLLIKNV